MARPAVGARRRGRGPFSSEALAYARQLATATHRFPDTRRALTELLDQWGAGLAGNRPERMALRLSEQRLRLVPDPPPPASGTCRHCRGGR